MGPAVRHPVPENSIPAHGTFLIANFSSTDTQQSDRRSDGHKYVIPFK